MLLVHSEDLMTNGILKNVFSVVTIEVRTFLD